MDKVHPGCPILACASTLVQYDIVVMGVAQRQGHFLAPLIYFTESLLSAYVPGIGDTVVNKIGCQPYGHCQEDKLKNKN